MFGVSPLAARCKDSFALQLGTGVLGVPITVACIDLSEADEVVPDLPARRKRQWIKVLDLP